MSYRIRVAQALKLNVEPVYALIATQGLPVAQRVCQGRLEDATLRVYHAFCRGAFDCRTGRENHHRWNGKWFLNSAGTQRSV